MEKIINVFEKITDTFAKLAGILMISGMLLVLSEVLMRTLLKKTLYVAEEYSAFFMLGISFLGFAYGFKEKSHVRMEFIHNIFNDKKRRYLDVICYTVVLILFVLITYYSFDFFMDALISKQRSMQVSKTLLAIPKSIMPIGSLAVVFQSIAEILKTILKIKSGNYEYIKDMELSEF